MEFNGVSLVLGDYEPIPQTTTSRWQTVLSSNGAFDIPSPTPKGNPLCPTRSKRLWRGTLFCLRKIDRLHKRFLFAGLADANAGRKDKVPSGPHIHAFLMLLSPRTRYVGLPVAHCVWGTYLRRNVLEKDRQRALGMLPAA